VTNLVENGVKWGRHVTVRLRTASPDAADVEVADDGPGIPDGDKQAMLRPFARGDAARGMNGPGGFGLGLSIARAIAEGHGGRLLLSDAEPSGLVARLVLPIATDGREAARSEPISAAA
jgi:signal transduction histidine kinase